MKKREKGQNSCKLLPAATFFSFEETLRVKVNFEEYKGNLLPFFQNSNKLSFSQECEQYLRSLMKYVLTHFRYQK